METGDNEKDQLLKTDILLQDEYYCDKNIDRTKFFAQNESLYLISACYHLDKSNNTKTGGIYNSKINYDEKNESYSIDKNKNFLALDYGILEYKINQENNLLFTANSNCTFSVFSIDKDIENTQSPFELKINNKIAENVNNNCCNFIELNKFNKEQILLAMNDGNFNLFDLNKQEYIFQQKAHEYGLWSSFIIDENTFLTGSEDSLLKMWDIRSKNCVAVNKSHQASINCIISDKYNFLNSNGDENKNIIITGSYDENIYFIDLRNFKNHIYKQKLDCSLWDIKQIDLGKYRKRYYEKEKIFMISCIYEGFRIFSCEKESPNESKNMNLDLIINKENGKDKHHKAIVYGVDCYVNKKKSNGSNSNDILAVSSSFYDNKIILWKFN